MLLGAHLSVAGGYHKALEKGVELGCTVVQIFLKNQRRWSFKDPPPDFVDKFIATLTKNQSIRMVIAHGSYLYNFSSINKDVITKSIRSLIHELRIADLFGIKWVVIHPGSHMGQGIEKGLDKLISSLIDILNNHRGDSGICIETNSGYKNSICSRFEEIGAVLSEINDERIGVCFDTCHVYSAGYPLGDRLSFDKTMKKFVEFINPGYLKIIHLNDNKKPLGSGADRHMHIGEGTIGEYCFKRFMTDEIYFGVPKVIETPKEDNPDGNDLRNLFKLKGYVEENVVKNNH